MSALPGHRPRTAAEFVATHLRSRILSGALAAGEPLRQNHIATELGVSSTPVREALRELVAEGLVSSDAHRSNVVRGLTLADVEEIYELRRLLEPILIRRSFASVSSEHLAEAEALIAQMAATHEIAAWSQLNGRFHLALSGPVQTSRMSRLVEGLRDASMPYVALSLYGRVDELERSNADHVEIIHAYKCHDCEAAVSLNDRHLFATIKLIAAKLTA